MSGEFPGLGPSGHVDDFARRNLPPSAQWPQLLLDRPEFQYPDYLNAAVELTDRIVEQGMGDRIALIGNGRQRTYKELTDWSNRLAHALVENYGVKPGNRVLIRSGNNPALVAAWLAATKAGAVVVNTMPMLRAGELAKIVDKAEISLALTDSRIADELVACAKTSKFLKQVVNFDGTQNHDAELDRIALNKPVKFDAVKTGRDDVALLGFTSGTTGEPKATMHFHRDLLIVADGYANEVLKVTPDDVFVGSPPLAFTFGLGGLAIFPLRFGATATLLENAAPSEMIRIIETYKATICFTAPTAYRAMMAAMDKGADLSSLRLAVSAGETLPAPVFESWTRKTGKPILDGIGSTELLHIFITNRTGSAVGGTTGTPVTGYEAKIVDEDMNELPAGQVGKLAVRGPTGCRYLADSRQTKYVRDGWNITGDAFVRDENGRLSFVARADDMIISAGYNIAGPEVEAALLGHPDVAECAVIGAPDEERGQIVSAFIVLKQGARCDEVEVKLLQDHVKATIAPYKYPRAIAFVEALPKTQTGKIQRFKLREAS
ncbi:MULTISPECIES: benzoate-CoA ligase family protein [Bradyrhizobium]|uniref:Benzoate-CoA ligase family protein n=1 Tax=Bradyrhizobium brasilense TaxID=1419277 RepID=A0ABY8J7T0_9BRAD|nr:MULTISPECIES: benzoate-CoA ligase family protein [Bradyrhizobium]KRQ11479.1 2-aminobenzoate-CoA ligase [Bradyrhizobium pachyrhizi]MCP1834342.1 2-aminobenzoate-CoA ligase [Bradyrhizobium sp. USDA 4545]MCP1853446.1 2-aminobenzoate-CoA ligase [Bradyrhizobium sp. USDA 4541]MCP1919088.1 2-aminobenzoate-CoA ligase [Bradyrhizobium sp. USDA 4532]OMI01278.1 2-aminobenzoate-CoA ligase [Bradyrhizobium brasilense]